MKPTKKKLLLDKNTLRVLAGPELARAGGGDTTPDTGMSWDSQDSLQTRNTCDGCPPPSGITGETVLPTSVKNTTSK